MGTPQIRETDRRCHRHEMSSFQWNGTSGHWPWDNILYNANQYPYLPKDPKDEQSESFLCTQFGSSSQSGFEVWLKTPRVVSVTTVGPKLSTKLNVASCFSSSQSEVANLVDPVRTDYEISCSMETEKQDPPSIATSHARSVVQNTSLEEDNSILDWFNFGYNCG